MNQIAITITMIIWYEGRVEGYEGARGSCYGMVTAMELERWKRIMEGSGLRRDKWTGWIQAMGGSLEVDEVRAGYREGRDGARGCGGGTPQITRRMRSIGKYRALHPSVWKYRRTCLEIPAKP